MNEEQLKLKVLAMKEALSTAIGNYEERVADLRVELTTSNQQRTAAESANEGLQQRIVELEAKISEYERETNDSQATTPDDDPA